MKNLILIAILFNASIFADYSNHKDSKEVIDELVNEHGFEESYVINVLKQAKKRKTALNSVARPAEKTKTWDDYKDETGNSRASRKNFNDSADFIGWYASKGYYQGFEKTDARSLYLAYHEGYGGFEKKTYRKKQWLIKVADRVQARSTKYQQQYWGCAKELKKQRFLFF